jgi:hypothetical protein
MAHSQAVDERAVFQVAVGNLPSAGDKQQRYRPHETPAKHPITGGAVDTGGTLRRLLGTSIFLPRFLNDQRSSKPPETAL